MRTTIPAILGSVGLLLIARAWPQDSASEKVLDPSRLRRPIALTLLDEGKRLLIANRDSGSITALDTESRKRLSETKIGRRLADLATTPAGDRVIVADEDAGEIVLLERKGDELRELRRVAVGLTPVSVQLSS